MRFALRFQPIHDPRALPTAGDPSAGASSVSVDLPIWHNGRPEDQRRLIANAQATSAAGLRDPAVGEI